MRIHGTAFSGEQVVIAIDFVQMRSLGEFDVRTAPNRTFSFRLELHRLHIEFGQCDAVEAMMVLTEIPSLLHQILAAIVVMEQACVEADTVHANRLAPRTMDTFGSDQIVRAILERTVHDLHVRVDQPEFAVRIGKIRSQMPPDDGLPRMSSWLVRLSGLGNRFQWTMSLDSCRRTPGNHSNVELAM